MNISDINIDSIQSLLPPASVKYALPATDEITKHVMHGRDIINRIITGKEKKLLVIVGPCSIHDKNSALEYARTIKKISEKFKEKLYIVMRVYFEKPRTNIGWKGLINDPYLDNSLKINDGLMQARSILMEINKIGLTTATEFVDTITPQYIADLVGWAAIGARTTESQPHRMLASGLSMPVGFKNNTAGNIEAAVNGVLAANHSHRFLSVTEQGLGAIVVTKGNKQCHVILRGGENGPNYTSEYVNKASELLKDQNLPSKIMIDCSHDNCNKDYKKQHVVVKNICDQLGQNKNKILGVMIESNLVAGKQALLDKSKLTYGQSITDGCIDLDETEKLLKQLADNY